MAEIKSGKTGSLSEPVDDKRLARRIKQHIIGKPQRFLAVVQPGFEEVARKELKELGITDFDRIIEGGIEFTSRLGECYRINLASRTLTRLLMRVTSFMAMHFNTLKDRTSEIPWELYIRSGTHISFQVQSRKSRLFHQERIKEALYKGMSARLKEHGIKAGFYDRSDKRAGTEGTQRLFVRFDKDKCRISLDTSSGFLYKRGRKKISAMAPLRETLASLILREAGWPDYDLLIDPMCGSGTFSLEAGEMILGRLPNLEREFIFKQWPAFRPA
ncbi:MAG: hypothetical protein ABIK28_22545, partial [Planctomycetota bacterium]